MANVRPAILALAMLSGAVLLAGCGEMPSDSAQPVPTAPAQPAPPAADAEAVALRAQLEEMRRAEDRLLQVIVGTFAVLVLVNVAGYVVLNRNYDRDRESIKLVVGAEAREMIGAEAARAAQERTRIERELGQRFDDRLQKATDGINARFSELWQATSQNSEHVVDIMKYQGDTMRSLNDLMKSTSEQMDSLQIGIWRLNAERQIDNGLPARAVRYYIWIAERHVEHGETYWVSTVLNQICSTLESAEPDDLMKEIHTNERQVLRELLDKHEARDEMDLMTVNRIRSILDDMAARDDAMRRQMFGLLRSKRPAPTKSDRPATPSSAEPADDAEPSGPPSRS